VSEPQVSAAYVDAVCTLHELRPGYYHETAIDKRPQGGRVEVTTVGLSGDRQIDSSHGGPDAAVYVYAQEDAVWWAERLGRDVPPGMFGENLRTVGLDVSGARLGERWRIGEVLLEVRKPRTPCANLSLRVGVDRFHRDFNRSGRVGAMCQVVHGGTVAAGDDVTVEFRPDHSVTVETYVTGMTTPEAERLLTSGTPLVTSVRAKARRVARR
jgi:MOSC domain-containing protein YiiM